MSLDIRAQRNVPIAGPFRHDATGSLAALGPRPIASANSSLGDVSNLDRFNQVGAAHQSRATASGVKSARANHSRFLVISGRVHRAPSSLLGYVPQKVCSTICSGRGGSV